MPAYYNEIDPYAAAWLRNLISAGHIAPGDVDERSIEDVRPDELRGYTQCHFFAGIGVWSYALRRAGWADDRPVWTGSCPCQPFSAAGKGGGFADERHLWPAFHHLIRECGPGVVFGEQVASKDGLAWLDLVQADLEGTGYASGAVDLCAAGVGAPHIRQRLWWCAERGVGLADAYDAGLEGRRLSAERAGERVAGPGGLAGGLADAHNERHVGLDALLREEAAGRFARHLPEATRRGAASGLDDDARLEGQRGGHRAALEHGQGSVRPASEAGQSGGLADATRRDKQRHGGNARGPTGEGGDETRPPDGDANRSTSNLVRGHPGPTDGLWRDADRLFCRDGKWRPVEPGTFPLAHGATSRVGRLRAYGNAIVAQAAEEFIRAYLDTERDRVGLASDTDWD